MKLFTFAHKKEAHAFINEMQFTHLPFYFDGLFKNETDLLLITGEGIQSTTEKLISVLAAYQKDITAIYNIGVAGSLSSKYEKDSIVNIRTVYAHHAERLEFKSFSTNTKSCITDCMSVHERALSIEIRKILSKHADIIDRELWAIGSASHLFKIPFHSIKYISDDLESIDFCKLIIENAEKISYRLFHYYLEQFAINETQIKNEVLTFDPFLGNNLFYFTTTLRRKYLNTIEQLAIKNIKIENVYNSIEIQEIIKCEILPKDRTKFLLETMTNYLNPFHVKILKAINKNISTLKKQNVDIGFDRNFEENYLHFSFKVKDQAELNEKIKIISEFEYKKIDSIFNGELEDI